MFKVAQLFDFEYNGTSHSENSRQFLAVEFSVDWFRKLNNNKNTETRFQS